jgi:cytochrome c1
MPPLGVLLKEQETADIVAYLDTLRTPPRDGVTVPVKQASQFE